MAQEYVQFGCGCCAPAEWRNFDAGPAFWLQRRLPFLKPLLQRRGYAKDRLPFVVTTEPTLNSTIAKAMDSIAAMDCMLVKPLALEMLIVDDKDEETA